MARTVIYPVLQVSVIVLLLPTAISSSETVLELSPAPGPVRWSPGFTVDIEMPGSREGNFTAKCLDSSGTIIDTDSSSNSTLTCEIGREWAGRYVDMEVEVCGPERCLTRNASRYGFDIQPPDVYNMNHWGEIVSGRFRVGYAARDDLGIAKLEYFYDVNDTREGTGFVLNISEVSDETILQTRTAHLEPGRHKLRLRARDVAGRWGDTRSVGFTFRPSIPPPPDIDAPKNLSVRAGERLSFKVWVMNRRNRTHNVTVKTESELYSASRTARLGPKSSTRLEFSTSTDGWEPGNHTLNITARSTHRPIELRVKPGAGAGGESSTLWKKILASVESLFGLS